MSVSRWQWGFEMLAENYLKAQFQSAETEETSLHNIGKGISNFIVSKTDPKLYEQASAKDDLEAYTLALCHKVQTGQITVTVAVADALQVIAIGEKNNAFFRQFIA